MSVKYSKMDAHFSKIFAPVSGTSNRSDLAPFIPSSVFSGCKLGYKFQKGEEGIGYYIDERGGSTGTQKSGGKRKRDEKDSDTSGNGNESSESSKEEDDNRDGNLRTEQDIERLLEEAEASGIAQLDATSLKQLILSLEKKITKNQKMRMKYPGEPSKFMESELELHAEIQELFAVAASPELYPILVQTGAVASILGLISHENTDISLAVVSLLQEMTDIDSVAEELEAALQLVEALVAGQGLELVVQNLMRLDENNSDEDAQGVNNSMAILQSLVEIQPEIAVALCKNTPVLKYLLERLRTKQFDANKLECSEVLCVLLQADVQNQLMLCRLQEVDGMDLLLQCIAIYRKKEVVLADEQECVENLFLCLCAAVQPRENQFKFLACEGFELLLRCLQEQQYAAGCSVKALSYAVSRNKACCERFVDSGGLKHVFPLLTGGGLIKALKRKGVQTADRRSLEENAVSIVAQLCTLLGDSQTHDYSPRLLSKLTEREHEKLERCVELLARCVRQLRRTDEQIDATVRAMRIAAEQGSEIEAEELEEFLDEDRLYAQRLEGGLFNAQQLALIVSFACIYDRSGSSLRKAGVRLSAEDMEPAEVLSIMRGLALTLQQPAEDIQNSSGSTGSSSSNGSGKGDKEEETEDGEIDMEKELNDRHLALVRRWCAALAQLLGGEGRKVD